MSEHLHTATDGSTGNEAITDPTALFAREGVHATTERLEHEGEDHCGVGTAGRAVVDVRNDAGEHLLLVNDAFGAAILPNGVVEPDGDWAAAAREGVREKTGIEVDLEAILAVRAVDHVLPGEDAPHLRTHRVVFRGSPVDGDVRDCKQTADDGSDPWRADWFDGIPPTVSLPPESGPRNDLQLALD